LAYVEQILVPTLKEEDIVVLDNMNSHKVAGVKEAIETVGAKVLYLPSYSPDFNPIEHVFSKLKTLARKLKLRKRDKLWNKLGKLCDGVPQEKCHNYCRNAGYRKYNVHNKRIPSLKVPVRKLTIELRSAIRDLAKGKIWRTTDTPCCKAISPKKMKSS
jgi:transposase